jgi:hypothetical protein
MNMKNLTILIISLLILGISSCHHEDPLEKERKEFVKSIEGDMALTVYRGVKITLRSFPINQKVENADSLISAIKNKKPGYENVSQYTVQFLETFMGSGNSDEKISVQKAFAIVQAFNKLKSEIKDKNEDDYPTLLEVIFYLNEVKNVKEDNLVKELKWNSAKEHLVLSAALMAAKPLPVSFQLYETSKLDIPKLDNTEIKPLAAMFKGMIMMQNKWYYLSEESLTQGIESLDAGNLKFEFDSFPSLFPEAKIDSREAEIAQLHGLSCLLRGFARTKMDDKKKKKLAVDDFELFVNDANKIGADNELVWLAGTYVSIKKEENEKAIVYLDKLQTSENFSDSEKEALKETKEYLSKRDPDKALNVIYDKVFIGKLVVKYLSNYISQVEWHKAISKTDTGKKLLGIPEFIDTEYKKLEKEMGGKSLEEKGKNLVKDIF